MLGKEDTSGSHLFPDTFLRVVQIEPKLILQATEYDKLAEALRAATNFIRPEDLGDQDMAEFERVQR